jgi:hypothetical protein
MPLMQMIKGWVVGGVPLTQGDDVFVNDDQARQLFALRVAFPVASPDALRVANAKQLALARASQTKSCCGK